MAINMKLAALAVDFICFLLVVIEYIVVMVFVYGTADGLHPHKRGFRCDDISIQRPVLGPETVPFEINEIVSFIIPITVILIVELANNLSKYGENEAAIEEEEEAYGPITLRPWVVSLIFLILAFCFGAVLVSDLTELIKITVGRLRPNFLSVCKPKITKVECTRGYITKDVCTGDPFAVKMARLSFPSGHASLSMYAMLFVAFYIQTAVRTDTKLLKPLLQVVAVSFALFVGATRVAENWHFFSDVLAGFAIGIIMAWFITFKVLKLFAIKIRKPRVYTLVPQQSRASFKEDADE